MDNSESDSTSSLDSGSAQSSAPMLRVCSSLRRASSTTSSENIWLYFCCGLHRVGALQPGLQLGDWPASRSAAAAWRSARRRTAWSPRPGPAAARRPSERPGSGSARLSQASATACTQSPAARRLGASERRLLDRGEHGRVRRVGEVADAQAVPVGAEELRMSGSAAWPSRRSVASSRSCGSGSCGAGRTGRVLGRSARRRLVRDGRRLDAGCRPHHLGAHLVDVHPEHPGQLADVAGRPARCPGCWRPAERPRAARPAGRRRGRGRAASACCSSRSGRAAPAGRPARVRRRRRAAAAGRTDPARSARPRRRSGRRSSDRRRTP